MTHHSDTEVITNATRRWVETVVVDLNLCPFAGRELRRGSIRFAVTPATDETELLAALHSELGRLEAQPEIETTLLIHPRVLQTFDDYNQFLESADDLLSATGLEGIYQIASFHPHYQFAETTADDVENYTNRSPYPMLHLLREDSLERAIGGYPDPAQIPQRNIALMKQLGKARLDRLLQECFGED